MLCPLQSLDRCTSGAGRVRRTVFTCSKLRQPLFAPCEFSPTIIFRTLGYLPRKDQSSAGHPSRPPANFGGPGLGRSLPGPKAPSGGSNVIPGSRSEERRVGKECRAGGSRERVE